MPRPATGQVVEKEGRRGRVYALRFRAYGTRQYVTLGTADEGWTRAKAHDELAFIMGQVRRGVWQPPAPEPDGPPVRRDPTFHEFASEWLEAIGPELRPATVLDYRWQLTHHLLPFFARHALSQITVAEVDRYRAAKVREGRLSVTSINKTITRLGQVLDVAEERELVARNPVRVNPRRRKLRAVTPARPYLDRAEQIAALLEAADGLDAEAARDDRVPVGRRAIIATLALAGLRVGELCALRWRDVDLATGRLKVGQAKTDAGVRTVDLLPVLHGELRAWKAASGGPADGFVFPTAGGQARDRHNVRERVVKRAAARASERLVEAGRAPLPRLTPHALRRTFASVLVALGADPPYVMGQIGHTDPALTLRLYAQVMRQGDEERKALQALVEGAEWAPLGTSERTNAGEGAGAADPGNEETPADAGASPDGRGWARTSDLSRVRRALSR